LMMIKAKKRTENDSLFTSFFFPALSRSFNWDSIEASAVTARTIAEEEKSK